MIKDTAAEGGQGGDKISIASFDYCPDLCLHCGANKSLLSMFIPFLLVTDANMSLQFVAYIRRASRLRKRDAVLKIIKFRPPFIISSWIFRKHLVKHLQ